MSASEANDGVVRCPFEQWYPTRARGAVSPRSDSPMGPAPTRVPRIAFPPAIAVASRNRCVRNRQTPALTSSPVPMMAMIQIDATNSVIRSRFFSTTLEPDRLDWTPPPNRVDRPPPRPRCRRIRSTSSTLEMISTICSASCIPSSFPRPAAPGYRRAGGTGAPGVGDVRDPEVGTTLRAVTRLRQWSARGDRTQLGGPGGGEAGAPGERAVHVGLRHDLADVARLDRPAVEHPDPGGDRLAVLPGQSLPERGAHLLGVGRTRHPTAADGPHRLVRDDQRLRVLARHLLQPGQELGGGVVDVPARPAGPRAVRGAGAVWPGGPPRLADRQSLPHAEDRHDPVLEGRVHLAVDERVVLAV